MHLLSSILTYASWAMLVFMVVYFCLLFYFWGGDEESDEDISETSSRG